MADIELVIKIPENTYRQIQALARSNYFEHDICGNSMRRIAKATPLPKRHGRLMILSEDKLKENQINLAISCQKWISEVGLSNATVAIIEADKAESEENNGN